MGKSFMREGKFNALNCFICRKGRLKLTKYRINKKIYLLQIFMKDPTTEMETCQQETIVVTLSLTCCKCSFFSVLIENKKQH